MVRYRDWYYKDWKPEERMKNGRRQTVYVYQGPFYLLPERTARFKLLVSLAAALYLAGFLVLNLLPSPCGRMPQLGGAAMLGFAPLLCALCGLPALLRADRRMTFRRFHRSIIRLRWAAVLGAVIALAHLILALYHIHRGGFSWRGEACYLATLAVQLLLSGFGGFRLLQMQFPKEYPAPGAPPLYDD